jgi:nucleotide-binding universal stress UspA family protein
MSLSVENIKKILIATDGSEPSGRAAELGVSMAKLLKAEIMAVFIVDTVVLEQIEKFKGKDDVEKEITKDGQGYVDYIINMAKKQGIKAEPLVVKGQPFEQIVRIAKKSNINLIVMGTHGHRGTERILIGSVTERVIEYASCPVLACK